MKSVEDLAKEYVKVFRCPIEDDDLKEAFISGYETKNERLNLTFHNILIYCEPHMDQMWAASIVGILLECEFRDAKNELEKYKKVTNG